MKTAQSNPFKAEGPQPLLREIPPGEPYPVRALGPLRKAVEAVQGTILAPVAIPAASALALASLAVQGFADVETLGGIRPVSLWRDSFIGVPAFQCLKARLVFKRRSGLVLTKWRELSQSLPI